MEETLKEVEKEPRGRETYWQLHDEACFSREVREDGVLAGRQIACRCDGRGRKRSRMPASFLALAMS